MRRLGYFLKGLVLATWLYSLLLWVYIVMRIVFSNVHMSSVFIDGIPNITFLNLGIFSFCLSFASLIIFVTFWGRRD